MTCEHAAHSDIGLIRGRNEDSLIEDPRRGLFGVADGVGGLPHGQIASKRTLEVICEEMPTLAEQCSPALLTRAVEIANLKVHKEGHDLNPRHGMGSTLTLGHLWGSLLSVVHVGDSRCYLWQKGRLTQVTMDHTVEHDPEFEKNNPQRDSLRIRQKGALTRCIGQSQPLLIETHQFMLEQGDRVLFCTDGMYRKIGMEELEALLSTAPSPAEGVARLVDLAKNRGGEDNITAVLLFSC